ncbi:MULTISPECIES: AAA domain-containing protein [Burkholderia]|uniref:AAA domain-containing protein n=1 Tax=Burkholderia TaxID=32008 RepID=UPI000B7A950E|nr:MULTISPECIES: AAA domain-containing protein [Burkholderia]OXJ00416.1 DNA helicase [Burkholderia sp. AU33803]PRD94792.1 DNA helicase [Burkholderia contaminans]
MHEKSIAFAAYWRNSLADAELGRGTLTKDEVSAHRPVLPDEAKSGILHEETVKDFFSGEDEKTQFVGVVYRPLLYTVRSEHGQRATQLPEFVTPLVTQALLSRDGCLLPKTTTVVPRDILQPLEAGSFYIGSIDDLDRFLTDGQVPGISTADVMDGDETQLEKFRDSWKAYRDGLDGMLAAVCGTFVSQTRQFLPVEHGLVLKQGVIGGATQHVVRLYDHIRDKRPQSPLFESYARVDATRIEPCLPANDRFASRLGHSSDRFALAGAQRAALCHVLASKDGEILAVNGPPGTGKTTLLLSVVASLWAQAALDESEPPVIFAASTNNQAVTNIIDAFGKDFSHGDERLGGRWLPDVRSFGSYFPSKSREAEASEKYQTSTFFDDLETQEYLDRAKSEFLSRAKAAFPDSDVADVTLVIARLHAELKAKVDRLSAAEESWHRLCGAKAQTVAELGNDPHSALDKRRQHASAQNAVVLQWRAVKDGWESYRAQESLVYAFFSWLPPVSAKRFRQAREHLKTLITDEPCESLGTTLPAIERSIDDRLGASTRARDDAVQAVKRGEDLISAQDNASMAFGEAARGVGVTRDLENLSIEQCDAVADTELRFQIFMLTTHYWEGRWLLETESQLPKILEKKKSRNPGPTTLMPRLRRRMMITPCAVSTFAMLPAYLLSYVRGDGKFDADYLYNFIDLLIVDEAGQVLPEIGGASFALARKALVIGDTQQIEPIWSVPRRVDFGNLMNLGLLTGAENSATYEELARTGKAAASGSVMLVAQNATRYHADPELDRGLYLYEHRRCYNEIIQFSNELCYHGKLLPRRGSAPTPSEGVTDRLPPMAYLHVDGICQTLAAGSRRNVLEAETIASWLCANRDALETKYGVPLHQIVGIVTPFAGQVAAIEAACAKVGIKAGRSEGMLTTGTVHSLQGAERHIVIFSSVYSKHEDGRFIDKSTSMLNVAVSRAKDSFIVFGDMDVFDSVTGGEPRGVLASFLFKSPANALRYEHRQRSDLQTRTTILSQLRDASDHDAFLLQTLSAVKSSFQIVTPWIILARTKEIGAFDAMKRAVDRGVKVEIFTDPQLNVGDVLKEDGARKEARLLADTKVLRDAGITVNFVRQVHSKLVIGDDDVYCIGSFNWFSAQRSGPFVRHETSMLYRGPDLLAEILAMRKSLLQRRISRAPYADSRTHKAAMTT